MTPDIDPDLAKKGSAADARNALQDVAHGDKLSPFHRDLLVSKVIGQVEPEQLVETRNALLLARYARAGHLTKEEMSEIRYLLPSMEHIGRRVTRDTYQRPLAFYAEQSGYEERNMKKWIKAGRDRTPIDLPPLDTPIEMPAWWGRNMKQRCPSRILAWASKSNPPVSASAPTTEDAPSAPKADAPPPTNDGSQAPGEGDLPAGKGYAATLDRWIEAERVAHRFYDQALRAVPFDEGLFEQRRRAYERASEMVRKLSIGKEGILATDEEWGRYEDFEEDNAQCLSVLSNSLRSVPVRLATKLALPTDIFTQLTTLWQSELDAIYKFLAEHEFKRAYQPDKERDELALAVE